MLLAFFPPFSELVMRKASMAYFSPQVLHGFLGRSFPLFFRFPCGSVPVVRRNLFLSYFSRCGLPGSVLHLTSLFFRQIEDRFSPREDWLSTFPFAHRQCVVFFSYLSILLRRYVSIFLYLDFDECPSDCFQFFFLVYYLTNLKMVPLIPY